MILNKDNASLRVKVFQALENAILNGEYKDGENLNEIKISNELGVSRTPVREAFMQLELEGLIYNIPNKGAVVRGLSEKDIEDIYEIRIRIEGLAARLCAENKDEVVIKEIEKIVDLQEYYLLKNDTEQLWELDSDFHELLYEFSGSRTLKATLSNFHNNIKYARSISMKALGRAEKSVAEHRAILEAIRKKDGNLAELLTAEHISKAKENLITHIRD